MRELAQCTWPCSDCALSSEEWGQFWLFLLASVYSATEGITNAYLPPRENAKRGYVWVNGTSNNWQVRGVKFTVLTTKGKPQAKIKISYLDSFLLHMLKSQFQNQNRIKPPSLPQNNNEMSSWSTCQRSESRLLLLQPHHRFRAPAVPQCLLTVTRQVWCFPVSCGSSVSSVLS